MDKCGLLLTSAASSCWSWTAHTADRTTTQQVKHKVLSGQSFLFESFRRTEDRAQKSMKSLFGMFRIWSAKGLWGRAHRRRVRRHRQRTDLRSPGQLRTCPHGARQEPLCCTVWRPPTWQLVHLHSIPSNSTRLEFDTTARFSSGLSSDSYWIDKQFKWGKMTCSSNQSVDIKCFRAQLYHWTTAVPVRPTSLNSHRFQIAPNVRLSHPLYFSLMSQINNMLF